jgi:hypothetical protein
MPRAPGGGVTSVLLLPMLVIIECMRLHFRLLLLPAVIINANALSLIHGSHRHRVIPALLAGCFWFALLWWFILMMLFLVLMS